jgi:short-subunit dehydrogenase
MSRPLALVTGSSSGIGLCYANALAARGFDLVLVARRGERLEQAAAPLRAARAAVEIIVADLGNRDELGRIVELCRARPLDLLVNNAGVAHYMPFATLSAERADEIVNVNIGAVVALTHGALPGMLARKAGGIINVASLLAFSGAARAPGMPARVVYAATKAFVVAFTQLLAAELEGTGVKAQVVCPGIVVSEFHTRQGIDMTGRPRLPAEDLVTGSLADLDAGVMLSVPTLEDGAALGNIAAAQANLLGQALRPTLAGRYRERT